MALSPLPAAQWSGPYVGFGVGTRFNAVDANVTSATVGDPATNIPLPTLSAPYSNPFMFWGSGPGAHQFIDHIAIGARVYGGWNVPVAWKYVDVIGIEGDFLYANETAVFHGSPYPVNLNFGSPNSMPFGASPDDTFRVKTKWDASVRARAGWLYRPDMLLYLTGGLAWASVAAESTCSTNANPSVSNCAPGNYFGGTLSPAVIGHSAVAMGWTLGAGVEMLLGPNWVARGQYRFADFGYIGPFKPVSFTDTRTCTGCSSANTPLVVSYSLPMMQHTFEIGLSYKFNPR